MLKEQLNERINQLGLKFNNKNGGKSKPVDGYM